MVIFRWIANLRGGSYCERALRETPNYNAHRTLEEHQLTKEQEHFDLDELIAAFPKPQR
jgi:hypothetical protein